MPHICCQLSNICFLRIYGDDTYPVPMTKLKMRVVELKSPVDASAVDDMMTGDEPSCLSSGGTLSNVSPWLPVELGQW